MRTAVGAALAGLLAGMMMSMAMMAASMIQGDSPWTLPDLISAMWLGPHAADGTLGFATLAGFATHEATSALMGVVAIPFVRHLRGTQLALVAMAYALASYPLVFSTVLAWANPLMFRQAGMLKMTAGHLLFGLLFAGFYRILAEP